MRGSTKTIKRPDTHTPSMRDAKDRLEKLFNNEKTVDAALFVMAVMLCGWLIYSLSNAIQHCAYPM